MTSPASLPAHHRISPSALNLYEKCDLAPAVCAMVNPLAPADTPKVGTATPAMARGTRIHREIARLCRESVAGVAVATGAVGAAENQTPTVSADMLPAISAWLSDIDPHIQRAISSKAHLHIEQLLSISDSISGTPDLVICHPDGLSADIYDWKTGQPEYVVELEHHRQMHAYGWLVRSCYSVRDLTYHLYFPDHRILESFTPTPTQQTQLEVEVAEIIERASRSTITSTVNIGMHCSICQGRYLCPAQLQMLAHAMETYPTWQLDGGPRTNEEALQLAWMRTRLKEATDRARDMLSSWVDAKGPVVDESTNKQYSKLLVRGSERVVNSVAVAQEMFRAGVMPNDILAHLTISRDAFVDLMGPKVAGGGAVAEQIWERFLEMGVVSQTSHHQLRWRNVPKPKEKQP
jgi:hypothetical protein